MKDIQSPSEPGAIEKQSFAIIESEVPEPLPFKGDEWLVVRRMIHTSADFELLSLVHFHSEAVLLPNVLPASLVGSWQDFSRYTGRV